MRLPKLRLELPVAPPTITSTPFEARPGIYIRPPLTLGFPFVMVSVDLFVAYRSINVDAKFHRGTKTNYRLIVKI
jgi:hypothetical protein